MLCTNKIKTGYKYMINILDKGTIDKIAAGEVVERPGINSKGTFGKLNRCGKFFHYSRDKKWWN